MPLRPALLAAAIASALLLTGCGGGGNTRPEAPPPVVQPPTPPPPVAPPPPPARYTGRVDNHVVPVNADRAHAAGFTGAGVAVGVLDGGATRSLPAMQGAVAFFRNYLPSDPASPIFADPSVDDVRGHGTAVAHILAGRVAGGFRGGTAPGASLHIARICRDSDGGCAGDPIMTAAMRDLIAAGVRIFNFSFGTNPFDPSIPPARGMIDTYLPPEALAANALFVWGAGNNGNDAQPNGTAAMPARFPEVARNALAVASIEVDDRGNPVGLSSFSSRCGVAAQWCLVAPGRVTTVNQRGETAFPGGTSFATPVVAGVAALTSQAFPWMGGDLLQLTLLTTARDLGDPGVDPLFGWGLVDAERAIRGPARFAFGDVTANVNRTGSWTWAHDIDGPGGLTKDGIGTLVLTGQNRFTGATRVQGGTLALNGGSLTSNVTVGSGATFESRGGRITGDFTALTGSTTGLQIGGPLTVTGRATLAGTANVLAPRDGHTIGGTETLLEAGSITGAFERATFQAGLMFTGTLAHTANRVSVNLTRKSAAAVASAHGGAGSTLDGARHFDAALAAADAGLASRDFLRAANALLTENDAAKSLAGLQTLSGEVHGTARNALLGTSDQVARALSGRLDGLEGVDEAGGWFGIAHGRGEFERTGFVSADTTGTTVLAGVDGVLGDAVVGGVLGVGEARADLGAVSGRFDADRTLAGVYGRTALAGGYVLGSLTHEWLDVDVRRVAGSDALATSREDRVWQARIEAGLAGDTSPFVALRHTRYTQGAFAETGGALGLVAAEDTQGATHAEIGVRHTARWDESWLAAQVRYQRLLSDDEIAFAARFVGSPASFTARGQEVRRNLGLAGFSFGHEFHDDWTLHADAEVEVGSNGVVGHRFGLGLRGEF